jgi:hypothetical protein
MNDPKNRFEIWSLKNSLVVDFIERLKIELSKESPYNQTEYFIANYEPKNHLSNTNLFYLLNSGRYHSGDFYMLFEEGNFVGCSGWFEHEGSIIAMSRAYLALKYRSQSVLAQSLLPLIISLNKDRRLPIIMTFNENRRQVYECFERIQAGKSFLLGQEWPEVFKLFKPKGKKKLFGYDQYIVEFLPEQGA